MVGADKLQRVHESLSNMANKKKGMAFGGASVICFGDLKQVKKKNVIKNIFRGEVEGILALELYKCYIFKLFILQLPPVKDRPIFKSSKIHGRLQVFTNS